ncbi:receptor-type tyrosine-protein phosphatase eta-like [Gigantopelta aegis]|uniref:receptor-type tyrosine-protein phosphatase eta-like n=1 Tax=Gigantopelta aegis TaxID=1735272 RepID=UPI001B887E20|nr:receptor-type tyrosine-protein phosphatase eta-like [Gigantopelta aegis]
MARDPNAIVIVTNLKEGSKTKCEQYWPESYMVFGPFIVTLVDEQVLPDFDIQSPILVHCSAGVGRTGTFIAVDIALEQASKDGVVDIAGIIKRLREQRMQMVQTAIGLKMDMLENLKLSSKSLRKSLEDNRILEEDQ